MKKKYISCNSGLTQSISIEKFMTLCSTAEMITGRLQSARRQIVCEDYFL